MNNESSSNNDEVPVNVDKVQNWQLDPSVSLSDWKLEISNEKDGSIKPYNVHCYVLDVGERKGAYFQGLLQSKSFAESKTRTSRIELASNVAALIPTMLDFTYDTAAPLVVSTTTAVALYKVGEYFIIPGICDQVEEFWKKDMTLKNCPAYYTQAKIFHNNKVVEAVKKRCVDSLLTCGVALFSNLLTILAIADWLDIKASLQEQKYALTQEGSELALQICQHNDVDWTTFETLISAKLLPQIA
jgi:hypothetical protein